MLYKLYVVDCNCVGPSNKYLKICSSVSYAYMMSNTVHVRNLNARENETLRQKFEGKVEFRRYGSEGQLMLSSYSECADQVRNMRLRPDDIFIQLYARSGTIVTQEIVWLLINNLDYETAAKSPRSSRCHLLERATLLRDKDEGKPLDDMESPRFFKTHLTLELLPPTVLKSCHVIHVARDPREACISFFNVHNRFFKSYPYCGDFKSYWELFINDLVLFTPYFSNIKQAWKQRNHQNMLFLFYDDFVKDLLSVVKRIEKFLGKEYPEAELRKLTDHVAQYLEPYFPVSSGTLANSTYDGKDGGWREHFDEEMRRQAQEWMQRHLSDTYLNFP